MAMPLECLQENHIADELLELLREIKGVKLSIKETTTLCLWLSGYSLKYSARILGVSAKTVQSHRTNIFVKLHMKSKDELVSQLFLEDTFFNYIYYTRYFLKA